MKIKRLISALIIVSMVLQMFCIFPASAEVGSELCEYDGYSVEYAVTNEWVGGQTTEVKITNTGDESILNWALKCDIEGEISNLWNAEIYDRNETAYIFKNCGWNYEIRPNESITFGYTLSGDSFSAPDSFTSCSERKTLTLGYSVDMNITSIWDTGVQGEIAVTNTSDEPLEAWCLSFDSSFTMGNIWDVRVLSNEDNHYVLASESWRNPIGVGETLIIGFVGSITPETPIEISNISLSVVVIDENAGEPSIFDKLIISAYGGYVPETETIDIAWLSTIPEGTFEVLTSADNIDYTAVGSVINTDSYSLPALSAQKYIKIRQTARNQTAESEPFTVTKTEGGYVVDYIDTDGDGLYDYIENAVGTDKNAPDSDNDGLSDYEEMLLTNSDPVVYNSVNERLSDGEADSDSDGLSNITEIELGTNALNPDTDGDGLNDGDEVSKYLTNPLDEDTDEDSISDGDELAIGLNPNNPETFGVPDAEYKFEQVISAESKALSKINTEENPYKLSVKMKAGGYAEDGLTAGETVYSNILENDSMLGIAAELSYPSAYEAEEIVLSFELSEEYVYDYYVEKYSGVNRYNVFKYFEDVNMLLPIPTEYDAENNTISAEVDELGTYCVMDMVSWFSGLDIPIEDEQAQPMLMSLADEEVYSASSYSDDYIVRTICTDETAYIDIGESFETGTDLAVVSEEPVLMSSYSAISLAAEETETESEEAPANIPIDVIFILQTESRLESEFETQKRAIIGSSNMLFNYFEDVRIHIIYFNYDEAVYFMNGYFTDVDSLVEHIDSITFIYSELERFCDKTPAHNILLDEIDFRDYSNKFVFDFHNGWAQLYYPTRVYESNRFNYSILSSCNISYSDDKAKEREESLVSSTGGKIIIYDENVKYNIYHHVLGGNGPVRTEYNIVYPFNWEKIALDKPLKRDGETDTDDDTLTDWQEIVKTGIALDASDYVIPPTIRQYVYATNNEYLIDYMEGLLEDEECTDELKNFINNTQILQVSSLPTSPDSDYDGYDDWIEIKIYNSNPLYSDVTKYSISSEYISVKTSSTDLSYGGNQDWWDNSDVFYHYKDVLSSTGCGTIAICDIIFYLNKLGLVDIPIEITYNSDGSINKDEYMKFVEYFYTIFRKRLLIGCAAPTFIISLTQILDNYLFVYSNDIFVNRYYYNENTNPSSFWFTPLLTPTNSKEFLKIITLQLNNNIPAILLNSSEKKVNLFSDICGKMNSPNNLINKTNEFSYHYVTVTEVINDRIMGDSILKVSSWGEEFYMYYSDFISTCECYLISLTIN